jgi:citrate lyase subunit beta / citryl-CoA lyase
MRRTMLFIPGNNPGMLINADTHGSDSIILDLEDAVSPNEKSAARCLVRNALEAFMPYGKEVIIRINDISTPYWQEDLKAVVPFRPAMIMPTKVSGGKDIRIISDFIGEIEKENGIEENSIRLIPLLETASGIEFSYDIATASPRMEALYLGAEDLTKDLHARRTKEGREILYARCRLLTAARTAGIKAYDTPFTDVDDMDGLKKDAEFARQLGFDGKAVISPRHVQCVNEVFSPSEAEIAYAKAVIEAIEEGKRQGKGAVSLNGKMIDPPIVARAQQTLDMARCIYGDI